MNYYNEIKNKLIENEINKKIKNYTINKNDITTYYIVGKLLFKAGKHYGEGIVEEYSKRLTKEVGKGYSKRNLWQMLKFYELIEKVQTLSAQLSRSHYCELLSIESINELNYYINITEEQNLSVRMLRTKVKNKEYNRLPQKTKNKLITKEKTNVKDLIKNQIIIKNSNDYKDISEKILQRLILENLPLFLKELGKCFAFIENEYKINLGDRYNYIDLLLFNYEFNCFVVVELKVTELKKEHIGQIEIYMNYIDENVRISNQEKTIGIIICKEDNKYIIKYCSDKRIVARKYEIVI